MGLKTGNSNLKHIRESRVVFQAEEKDYFTHETLETSAGFLSVYLTCNLKNFPNL